MHFVLAALMANAQRLGLSKGVNSCWDHQSNGGSPPEQKYPPH